MKLPIKKKYFDDIKAGLKDFEIRDAHITFVCEETGETLRRDIEYAIVRRAEILKLCFSDVISDDFIIFMKLRKQGVKP